ncbi:MAG: bifunctional diaminohydroxyphosphoribosylaminopyrimidine deaminase/5-amino-6-(5-phosphoribosylamino)uracil reductase RibD [Planctomycetota bacterium]
MEAHPFPLLARAQAEARRGEWLFTAPNPRVGALALKNGHLVGRGFHGFHGGAHAEEQALREAAAWDDGAARPVPGLVDEMVVTLEPCSAPGAGKKRSACTELLQAAGIGRVHVGAVDPDPRHCGRGLALLREQGIEVVHPPGGDADFEALNRAFLRALRHPERPWILFKWAASLDGKTAAATGASRWITSPAARAEAHTLRAASDAVMVGRGTLYQDDPELTVRSGPAQDAPPPVRVLVDPEGQVPEAARVFRAPGPRLWLLREGCRPGAALSRHLAGEEDQVMPVPVRPDGRLDLCHALRRLRLDFGVRRLLVEGGAVLHGGLLAEGLVDAVVCYEAPCLLGGTRGAVAGGGAASPREALHLIEEEQARLGPDLRRAFQVAEEEPL